MYGCIEGQLNARWANSLHARAALVALTAAPEKWRWQSRPNHTGPGRHLLPAPRPNCHAQGADIIQMASMDSRAGANA